MRLNPNCIRDLLLTVEEHSDFHHQTEYHKETPFERLSHYSHEEIIYHIKQCDKSNLISDVHYYDGGNNIDILDLTPQGHEFLANIRNDSVWKKVVSKCAGASLPVMLTAAKDIAMKYFLS